MSNRNHPAVAEIESAERLILQTLRVVGPTPLMPSIGVRTAYPAATNCGRRAVPAKLAITDKLPDTRLVSRREVRHLGMLDATV